MKHPLWTKQFGFRAAPTIVLLHGAFTNSAAWNTEFVHRLVDRNFHVVAMDLRDSGKSHWKDDETFTIDDMANDVLYTMTVHRIGRAHLLGASMGGSIALRMALLAPERCLTAHLLATTPGRLWHDPELEASTSRATRAMGDEMKLARQGRLIEALRVRARAFGDDEGQHAAIIRQGYRSDSKQGIACMNADSLCDRLHHIRTPTLVIHGEEDEVFPVQHAWRMHHGIRTSKLLLIPGVNHCFPTAHSASLADAVADFIVDERLPSWQKKKPPDQA